jgi:hypothetical protein
MSGEADDAKHGKEHNRKRKLSHFDELLYYIILEYWCCDDTNSTVNIRTRQDPRGLLNVRHNSTSESRCHAT